MTRVHKKVQLEVSGFYDGGLVRLDDVEVPSKRVGYKKQDGILVASVPLGVPAFETAIANAFVGSSKSGWPLKGRLFVAISFEMPKASYVVKDVDNMAKSILDAFRGIAYADDKQIDSLFVSKCVANKWRAWVAIKSLGTSPKNWFVEPLLRKVKSESKA